MQMQAMQNQSNWVGMCRIGGRKRGKKWGMGDVFHLHIHRIQISTCVGTSGTCLSFFFSFFLWSTDCKWVIILYGPQCDLTHDFRNTDRCFWNLGRGKMLWSFVHFPARICKHSGLHPARPCTETEKTAWTATDRIVLAKRVLEARCLVIR